MDASHSSRRLDSMVSKQLQPLETQESKRRKVVEKTVVAVQIEANDDEGKVGAPSDCWSWRKYGQKPIKGSPFPRGYYKCSTCKGCSAKKQVERCKTDASMLIITYTSTHTHPTVTNNNPLTPKTKKPHIENLLPIITPTPKLGEEDQEQQLPNVSSSTSDHEDTRKDDFFYSQSPFNTSSDIIINQKLDYDSPRIVFDDVQPLSYPHLMTFPKPISDENDFFDELEELPPPPPTYSSSSFTSFLRTNFFEERILVYPS